MPSKMATFSFPFGKRWSNTSFSLIRTRFQLAQAKSQLPHDLAAPFLLRCCNWLGANQRGYNCLIPIIALIGAALLSAPVHASSPFPLETASGLTSQESDVKQDPANAASFAPATTILYVELNEPSKLVDELQSHSVTNQVLQLEQIQAAFESEQYQQFEAGLKLAEFRLGMKWPEAIDTIAGQGAALALDPNSESFLVFLHGRNEEALSEFVDDATSFLKAISKQNDDTKIESKTYRGYEAYQVNELAFVGVGEWLILSNKPNSLKEVVDRHLDGGDSLADNSNFSIESFRHDQESAEKSSDSDLSMWVDVEKIRESGLGTELFDLSNNNLPLEFLAGGIRQTLTHCRQVQANLNLEDDHIKLSVSSPFEAEWIDESRSYYFGDMAEGKAPVPLQPENIVLNVVSYRDLGGLWMSKDDLFPDNVLAELAQADSNLSTVFGGVDFGADILGAVDPGFQIVVVEQEFEGEGGSVPKIQLPAAAAVFTLKDPEKVQRRLKIAYQSLIGFVNIGLGQNGQPQLEMDMEKIGSASLVSASYLIDDDFADGQLTYNFSPSVSFVNDRFIFASTRELAAELSQLAEAETTTNEDRRNTQLTLTAEVLASILQRNREQLVVQNMLEEGNDRDTAEGNIDLILSVVRFVDSLDIAMGPIDGQLSIEAEIKFPETE